ncbi:MAG: GNAT family N-acetyltransferase [Caldilineaceae bacterium]
MVGFNFAGHYPSMKPGQYFVNVVVDPVHRHQGIGSQLWQDLLTYLQAQGRTPCLRK